jgi:phospholipid/cholesterol/gamma-HCH transport system substrate-binding protein
MSIKPPAGQLIKTEMIVGLFFIIAITILAYFTIILNPQDLFQKKHNLSVSFTEHSGNLKSGANVRIKGVIIGRVSSVEMSDDFQKVLVHLQLDKEPVFYRDYKIQVVATSLLGGEFLNVELGSPAAGELPADSELLGLPPQDLMGDAAEVVSQIRQKMDQDDLMEKISTILKNMEKTSDDFKEISGHIREGKGTIGQLIYDDKIIKDLEAALAPLKNAGSSVEEAGKRISTAADEFKVFGQSLNEMTAGTQKGEGLLGKLLYDDSVWKNIESASGNVKTFTENLNNQDSTINKMLNDRGQLYEEFKIFIANIGEISEKINSGEGTLARLINDDDAYQDFRTVLQDGQKALKEVQHAVQDFREQAPISTFGGIIFGAL